MNIIRSESVRLQSLEDIVNARQAVRAWMVEMKFSLVDQTKMVTAASELARNTVEYGGGGSARMEELDAAATKPFGYLKFLPGPGLGGHCIPIDPFYLSWKAKMAGFEPRFIELAGQINAGMPDYVVSKVNDALNELKKSIRGSRVLVLGVAYKANVSDTRESPAIDIIRELRAKGATVAYADPHVDLLEVDGIRMRGVRLSPASLRAYDCAVIVADHEAFDYRMIIKGTRVIVDTRNALRKFKARNIRRI
jgi:UDP-N-acetyl-D-glucosamine dehydrogenase